MKAFEGFKVSLTGFFFLPTQKIFTLLRTLVFTVYLYGAELWSPFVLRSLIQEKAFRWLLGLAKGQHRRLLGWIQVMPPDVEALGRVVKTMCEARKDDGLLKEAISQFVLNAVTEGTHETRSSSDLWLKLSVTKIRQVWPAFAVSMGDPDGEGQRSLIIDGIPADIADGSPKVISSAFCHALMFIQIREHFSAILSNAPGCNQQQYVLWHILRRLPPEHDSPLFPHPPRCPHYQFQDVIRLLSGTMDFARVHAHYVYRKQYGDFPESLKRACLLCAARNLDRQDAPMDSEWHMLFGCPITETAREQYKNFISAEFSQFHLMWDPTVESLSGHIIRIREFPSLFDHFARFLSRCLSARHQALRRLKAEDIRTLLRVTQNPTC